MPPKRKPGLSLEEKTTRVEHYLLEHRQPFTLKELESLLPKAKGVIFQSVAECLDTLVSENRAHSDKVGVSTYFWNFDDEIGGKCQNSSNSTTANKNNSIDAILTVPLNEEAILNQQNKNKKGGGAAGGGPRALLEAKRERAFLVEERRKQISDEFSHIQNCLAAVTESEQVAQHRRETTKRIGELRAEKLALESACRDKAALMAFSPLRLQRQYALMCQVVNLWTDNVMLMEDAAVRNSGGGGGCVNRGEFRQKFGIDNDFDFV